MININTSFKRIHSLLILTFLCFLILINKTYSEEKIGGVVALKGEITAINTDDEKRTLDIYDDIFLFDEIIDIFCFLYKNMSSLFSDKHVLLNEVVNR